MIEKKFRAWDRRINKWFHTELEFKGFALFGECTLNCPPGADDLRYLEITQYTGMKDKHGTEIYEGDILQNQFNKHKRGLSTVIFADGAFTLEIHPDGEQVSIFVVNGVYEVIGNIYENPELL